MKQKHAGRMNPHEFYIGMLLEDAEFFKEQEKFLNKTYGDDRLNRILAVMKNSDPNHHFEAIYRADKLLGIYAMQLANFVAKHKINNEPNPIKENTTIKENLVNFLPEHQRQYVDSHCYNILVEKLAAFLKEVNIEKRSERKQELQHAKECFENMCETKE